MTSTILAILLLISFVAGLIMGYIIHILEAKGTLYIAHAPEKDKYKFEIDNLETLEMNNYVTLRIKVEDEEYERMQHMQE